MKYLKETEILPYIHAGKEVEQFLGAFQSDGFQCFRYITFGKNKDGYFALLFEVFDDSNEGQDSIYDYSSIEPNDLNGKEVGPCGAMDEVLEAVREITKLAKDKYLLPGYLDDEMKVLNR